MPEKAWISRKELNPEQIDEFARTSGISDILATLLLNRGINTFEEANTFFNPSISHLHDPFLMKDMDDAANRVIKAIENREKVMVYGDYDVDGTTAVTLMYDFLTSCGADVLYYLPDRYREGYGVSEAGVQFATTQGCRLIITLDCGIRAVDTITIAAEAGIDVIICDHHLPSEVLPPATAILDPKQSDCAYPYGELSGCGLAFKLAQAVAVKQKTDQRKVLEYLDLVCVSICADIVPITGENRVLTHFGLKKINQSPRAGIQALMNVAGKHAPMTVSDVVFGIAPRINAAGRLAHAKEAVQLLLHTSLSDTEEDAIRLNQLNTDRKKLDEEITDEALSQINDNEQLKNGKSTVLFDSKWHKGVIGIVASRVIESHYRPTIVLTESNGKATGSARSVSGFNIHDAIASCSYLLEQFGGHKYAAGLTLAVDKVEAFRTAFEKEVAGKLSAEAMVPKVWIDSGLDFDAIDHKLLKTIERMAPFGPGNPSPVFVSKKVLAANARVVGENHLKMWLKQEDNKQRFDAIAFGMSEWVDTVTEKPLNIAFHLERNSYQGVESIQLVIKDLELHVA